jgi:hypothetical protein
LETKDAGEEEMERNNWASQNSQRLVELKEEEEEEEEEEEDEEDEEVRSFSYDEFLLIEYCWILV